MSEANTIIDTAENVAEEIVAEQTEAVAEASVRSENKLLGIVLGIFMGLVWQPENNEIGTKVLMGMLIFNGAGAVIGLAAGFLGGKDKDKKEQ